MNRDTQQMLIRFAVYGAIGVGLYYAAKNWHKILGTVVEDVVLKPLADVGGKIGSGLYDAIHPTREQIGESLFYTPMFPDGIKHAVGSLTVAPNGTFTLPKFYGATLFQLATDRVTKLRVALPVKR